MQKRRIGQTDLYVSAIGLGTVKFGRNEGVKYPSAFELPTDAAIDRLLGIAAEQGINFIDTAPAYGCSEERLGRLLPGSRLDWVIATKAGETFADGESTFDFSPAAITASVHRSLRRLQTDYLDLLLIHSDGRDEAIIHEEGVFTTLAALKQAGKIRAFGMSTKTVAGGLLTLAHADVAMVTFNPNATAEREVIARGHQTGKGILIKKALASGHLPSASGHDAVSMALQTVFNEPGVSSVIIGSINPQHLRSNIACAREILGDGTREPLEPRGKRGEM